MTDQEIKAKMTTLTESEQRMIDREAAWIRNYNASYFFQVTGLHANDNSDNSYWGSKGLAMLDLGVITSNEFFD